MKKEFNKQIEDNNQLYKDIKKEYYKEWRKNNKDKNLWQKDM